jgi:hypothetical protein
MSAQRRGGEDTGSGWRGVGPWAGIGRGLKSAPGAFSSFPPLSLFSFSGFLLIFGLKTFTKPLI